VDLFDGNGDFLTQAAKELFGLDYLFPYQRLVISNIIEAYEAIRTGKAKEGETNDRALAGRQIVILPTGAGKSLCFQLPAMLMEGTTLVLYPILSLMADQERRLLERGFAPVLLRGGQSAGEREAIFRRVRSGESRLVIANPEVLLTAKMTALLPSLNIVHIAIDEAHCAAEWGESFRPSYLRLSEIIEASGNSGGFPMVTAFTATASSPVLKKIEQYVFGSLPARRIIGSPDRANIYYAAKGVLARDLAVRDLLAKNKRPAVVFCSSREGTEMLARYLGFWFPDAVKFYHAGLSRDEKTAVERWFFAGKGILTATCAYGMGVDKSDIRTVIHRDCPPSAEAYLQESGRAGRDGLESKAVLLWGPDDRVPGGTGQDARLKQMLDYGRNIAQCRREVLLGLMNQNPGEENPQSIENCCDVCSGEASPDYREARSLSGFFCRNRRRYTLDQAVKVLTEAGSWSGDEARLAVQRMTAQGRLRTLGYFPWKGKITV
jgi:ATP-dependent DNA helicase RecQ